MSRSQVLTDEMWVRPGPPARRRGWPLSVRLTAGQDGDNPQLLSLLQDIAVPAGGAGGRPRHRPDVVVADKAYSHPSTRKALRGKGIAVVIPEKSDQVAKRQAKGSAGGRPPAFDPQVYAGRNVVERAFNRLKGWHAIAARYDKHARNYRAGVVIASIVLFRLKRPSDTPEWSRPSVRGGFQDQSVGSPRERSQAVSSASWQLPKGSPVGRKLSW